MVGFKHKCAHCGIYIRENKREGVYPKRAGTATIWPRLEHYLETNEGSYQKEDYLCDKFQTELLTFARKTGFQLPRQRHSTILSSVNTTPTNDSSGASDIVASNCQSTQGSSLSHTDGQEIEGNIENSSCSSAHEHEKHSPVSQSGPIDHSSKAELEERQSRRFNIENMEYDESCSASVNLTNSELEIQAEACYSQSSSQTRHQLLVKKLELDKIYTVPSTQSRCFVCGIDTPAGRKTFPESATLNVWLEEKIFIPFGCKSCKSHHQNGIFKEVAKIEIRKKKKQGGLVNGKDVQRLLFRITELLNKKKNILDFDDESANIRTYEEIVGLSKKDFDVLLGYILPYIKDSKNRSPRNALAIFLAKLRLGLSQKVIGRLFGVSQGVVSSTFRRICELLVQTFVPLNLGYDHMSREEIIDNHNPGYVRNLFDVHGENLAILADGTYVFIQQSKDHELQSETWSPHKHRHLVKFMMIVHPDGYILSAPGPWKSNGRHGDSNIMNRMIEDHEFMQFLKPGDHVIADRGFQRTKPVLESKQIHCTIPPHLNGRSCFDVDEANLSRKVTLVRWVVEAVNGRIKNLFDFFNNIVPNTYLPIVGDLFQIACAINNRFCPPLFQESEKHKKILETVQDRLERTNRLQDEIIARGFDKRTAFKKGTSDDVPTFPKLNKEDFFELTLGVYQMENASHYNLNHVNKEHLYELMIHKVESNLLRAKLKSKFRRAIKHTLWIEFDETVQGADSINGYYCECQIGSRVIGMCSHVTAVIWHLSYARHQPKQRNSKRYSQYLLDVAETSVRIENPGDDALDDEDSQEIVITVPVDQE